MHANTIHRLSEYDPITQRGDYRTKVILTFEAEYDTFVDPEMKWGTRDTYHMYDNRAFYFKPNLLSMFEVDQQNNLEDEANEEIYNIKLALSTFLGYPPVENKFSSEFIKNVVENKHPDFIKNLIKSKPGGLPAFVGQTQSFYEFKDVGTNELTVDDFNKEILQKIQSTFTDDYNPFLFSLHEGLYEKEGNIYLTDLTKWSYNPVCKLGVFVNPQSSELYGTGTTLFFPFGALTERDREFVNTLSRLETSDKEVRIVTL